MKCRLGDLARVSSSKRIYAKEYTTSGIPFYRGKEIIELGSGHLVSNKLFISKDRFNQIRSKYDDVPEKDDVLITAVGTIGETYLVKSRDLPFYFKDGNLIKLSKWNRQIVLPEYMYYWLNSYTGKMAIKKITIGSTQQAITIRELSDIELDLPPIREQGKIAQRLTTLDFSIYNNKHINANLLELISLIQNEYSRTISNKVSLKSLAQKIITGKTPSTKIQENYGYDIPFVKIPDMHDKVFIDKTGQSLSLQGANSQKNKYLPANAIMVSCIGTPGLVSLTGSVSQTNQQINSLILEDKFIYWSFLELRSLRSQIGNLGSGGTTINNLNKSDFSKLEIIIPDNDEVLDNFNHIAQPIFERIHTNNIEIRKLTQLKEALLNKLF